MLFNNTKVNTMNNVTLSSLMQVQQPLRETEICTGCANQCKVQKLTFDSGNVFYSGNNCEKVYTNKSKSNRQGVNLFAEKYKMLFQYSSSSDFAEQTQKPKFTIGIPRALGMYADFPFYATLFAHCGIKVVLSAPTHHKQYEAGLSTVMADNICMPAKLMHGHVLSLVKMGVSRIFYPYVVYGKKEDKCSSNSYHCPVVSGYSDVIKSAIDTQKKYGIPFDSPILTFNNPALLHASCLKYLTSLGIDKKTASDAIYIAQRAQQDFAERMHSRAMQVWQKCKEENRLAIVLVGRPYHLDPYVEHKISYAMSAMGVDVITDDIAMQVSPSVFSQTPAVSQWTYPNKVIKTAFYVASQDTHLLQMVQLTSFGCGPDAFILDEVRAILGTSGKNHTILKIDDVNNIGSLVLRVRSLVESLRVSPILNKQKQAFYQSPIFNKSDKGKTILAPYFSKSISAIISPLMKLSGYNVVMLPSPVQCDVDMGLRMVNNDVCFPATVVVGQLLNALKSGQYSLKDVAVIISQTGGQCRASNYITLIKRSLSNAGLGEIPVLSFDMSGSMGNVQPGFSINWRKILPIAIHAVLFIDCLTQLYRSSIVREKEKGVVKELYDCYLERVGEVILQNRKSEIKKLLQQAVAEFTRAIDTTKKVPSIGVVGEIYVKYNEFSNKNLMDWLQEQGIEVIEPSLYGFLTTSFANRPINKQFHIQKATIPLWLNDLFYVYLRTKAKQFDAICSDFPFYRAFTHSKDNIKRATKVVSPATNFGEGWLLPAEVVHMAESGVHNIVSIQPFGCIANHIISKGVEKKLKQLFPQLSMLFLDFDGNTSEANVINRLYFMAENAKKELL